MTEKDFQHALIRGYLQTQETQIDFLFAEAEKLKVNPKNFYKGLLNAYKGLEQRLNLYDYRAWTTNEKGEKEYSHLGLRLHDENKEYQGTIFNNHLPDFYDLVERFGKAIDKEQTGKYKQIKGFQTSLSNTQIESLYTQMQGDYIDTDKENFRAMLTGKECYIISWKHKNPKGGVNQTSLVAFIDTILKQTKKVAKTHFGIEVKSINRDANYKHYVTKYKTIIE